MSHLHEQSFRQTDLRLLETEEKIKLNPNVLFNLQNKFLWLYWRHFLRALCRSTSLPHTHGSVLWLYLKRMRGNAVIKIIIWFCKLMAIKQLPSFCPSSVPFQNTDILLSGIMQKIHGYITLRESNRTNGPMEQKCTTVMSFPETSPQGREAEEK